MGAVVAERPSKMAAGAAGFYSTVLDHLKIFKKEVEDENLVFKMFTKATFVLFILCAILVSTSEFFGDKIICQGGSDIVHAFCWINGAKHVPESFITAIEGVENYETELSHWGCRPDKIKGETNGTDTLYYQWVPFMLVISAVIFKIPDVIWGLLEGGFMKSFADDASKSVFINKNEEDKKKKELISLFGALKGNNKGKRNSTLMFYYFKFLFCQILNIALLIANFTMTSAFLDTDFSTYGTDVLESLSDPKDSRANPMCQVFPTAVSCTYFEIGTGGKGQTSNHLCILSQNIINEKIYLGLWFWFIFLATLGSIQMLYELIIIALPAIRLQLTLLTMGSNDSEKITDFLYSCNFADWFFLNQIGKNTEKKFYREFIKGLAKDHASKEEEELKNQQEGNLLELKVDNPQYEEYPLKKV